MIMTGTTVYLSGAISVDPGYKEKFRLAAEALRAKGARVLSPAELPDGWHYGEYMEHCMLMVQRADTLVLLPCWPRSPGAKAEKAYAENLGRLVIDYEVAVNG